MTERTLREKISALVASAKDEGDVMFNRAIYQVLDVLDAHTAAQPAVDVSEPHVDEHQRGLSVADERQKPAPDAVAEARDISDFPEDGTWAVLHPGYYGPFTACWVDGAWRLCEDADLRQATCWTPLDIAALTKGTRP